MVTTSQSTIQFHFILDSNLLHHIGPNYLTVSSPIIIDVFQLVFFSLSYTTWWLCRFTCCLWILQYIWPSKTCIFCILQSHPSLFLSQQYWSSFFKVTHISLAYNIATKMVLFKRLLCRFLSTFALSTSFIVVNGFHPDLIHHEISASVLTYIH